MEQINKKIETAQREIQEKQRQIDHLDKTLEERIYKVVSKATQHLQGSPLEDIA